LRRYTSQGIVFSLALSSAAQADLVAIEKSAPEAAAQIRVVLQEIKSDQKLLDGLTEQDFGYARNEKINVAKWQKQQRAGRNLWRVKLWNLEDLGLKYRVLYCLDPRVSRYYVLAIIPRVVNYDEKHPRIIRVLSDYDALGIPSYR
jgi:hypothetical protein